MYCKRDVERAIDASKGTANTNMPVININNVNTNTNTNTNIKSVGGRGVKASPKSKATALLLCIFLGYLGVHRYYVGQSGMGTAYLFTLGLFGIGWIVDIFIILAGGFKDKYGRSLV
jgi:hypothetical protein